MDPKQLPPQEGPKQLTAYQRPQTLYEHFMAFMNANNQNGFMDDKGVIADYTKFAARPDNELFSIDEVQSISKDTVAGLLLLIATKEMISYKELLRCAYEIKEVSNKKIPLNKATIIAARMAGYFNMEAVYRELCTRYRVQKIERWDRDKFMVINRRDRSMLQMKFLEQS